VPRSGIGEILIRAAPKLVTETLLKEPKTLEFDLNQVVLRRSVDILDIPRGFSRAGHGEANRMCRLEKPISPWPNLRLPFRASPSSPAKTDCEIPPELQRRCDLSPMSSSSAEPMSWVGSPIITHESAIGLWTTPSMIELPPQFECLSSIASQRCRW
jgi:hypothetical protein